MVKHKCFKEKISVKLSYKVCTSFIKGKIGRVVIHKKIPSPKRRDLVIIYLIVSPNTLELYADIQLNSKFPFDIITSKQAKNFRTVNTIYFY